MREQGKFFYMDRLGIIEKYDGKKGFSLILAMEPFLKDRPKVVAMLRDMRSRGLVDGKSFAGMFSEFYAASMGEDLPSEIADEVVAFERVRSVDEVAASVSAAYRDAIAAEAPQLLEYLDERFQVKPGFEGGSLSPDDTKALLEKVVSRGRDAAYPSVFSYSFDGGSDEGLGSVLREQQAVEERICNSFSVLFNGYDNSLRRELEHAMMPRLESDRAKDRYLKKWLVWDSLPLLRRLSVKPPEAPSDVVCSNLLEAHERAAYSSVSLLVPSSLDGRVVFALDASSEGLPSFLVKDVDGNVIQSRVLREGSSWEFNAEGNVRFDEEQLSAIESSFVSVLSAANAVREKTEPLSLQGSLRSDIRYRGLYGGIQDRDKKAGSLDASVEGIVPRSDWFVVCESREHGGELGTIVPCKEGGETIGYLFISNDCVKGPDGWPSIARIVPEEFGFRVAVDGDIPSSNLSAAVSRLAAITGVEDRYSLQGPRGLHI